MRTILVRCTFTIQVEIPDEADAIFMMEDNGCPGTGVVGATLDAHMQRHNDQETCWACALQGKNEIVG